VKGRNTVYRTFQTERRASSCASRRTFTGRREAGVSEGMALVSRCYYGGRLGDDVSPGLQEDPSSGLDKLAPPTGKEPANDVARELLSRTLPCTTAPCGGRGHGDAPLKNRSLSPPCDRAGPRGRLDLDPGHMCSYAEFAARSKALVIKVSARGRGPRRHVTPPSSPEGPAIGHGATRGDRPCQARIRLCLMARGCSWRALPPRARGGEPPLELRGGWGGGVGLASCR